MHLYGFDVPGSPGNPQPVRGITTALEAALAYLVSVDSGAAGRFRERVGAFLRRDHKTTLEDYGALNEAQRDRITAAVADLVGLVERRGLVYSAATSDEAYQWGWRHAVGARQIDTWLRELPPGWSGFGGEIRWQPWMAEAHQARDRAMMDNVMWILEREGPDGRVMIFASRYHLSGAPVRIADKVQVVLGRYLRQRFGAQLVSFGEIVQPACYPDSVVARSSYGLTIDDIVTPRMKPSFLLDLRRSPAEMRRWLDEKPMGDGQILMTGAGKAFDVLWYGSSRRSCFSGRRP